MQIDIERPPIILQAGPNLGVLEISTFLSLILYGIFTTQVYTFFGSGRGDSIWLKCMVALLFLLESCHSFTASQTIYDDTITHWRTEQPNSYPLSTTVLLETLVTLIVHLFFTHRIHKLSKHRTLAAGCLTLAVLRFLGGSVLVVEIYKDVPNVPNGVGYAEKWAWLITTALTVGATLDITIALSMSYYLRKLVSPDNYKSTAAILNRLVRWSLQTGLLTRFALWRMSKGMKITVFSFVSILVVISFRVMGNLVWFGVYIILAKLYSNALLVSLNARPRRQATINEDSERNFSTALHFAEMSGGNHHNISLHLPTTGLKMESQMQRIAHISSGQKHVHVPEV